MNAIGSREYANGCCAAKALKPERTRELVRAMCAEWAVSIRKACGALRFDCSSYHYKSRRTDPAELKRRIREICETRVRYGYRRVYVVLEREGWEVSIKMVYNVYRALGLQLRNKTPKRRVKAKLRDDRVEAVGPNDVCANHVSSWRTLARKGRLVLPAPEDPVEFAVLMVGSTEDAPRADVGGEARPEIIAGAVVIRLEAGATADRIASVVRALATSP